jgi:hypothetical protein
LEFSHSKRFEFPGGFQFPEFYQRVKNVASLP